jgi:hydrogenase maturation protease
MGNKFFGDDGVGIVIAEKLKSILSSRLSRTAVTVEETGWGGLRIIDLLSGYKQAIIIDSLKTGKEAVGFIHKLDYKDIINSVRMVSFHDVNFATTTELAKELGIPMPEEITVYAIEAEEVNCFSEKLTPAVEKAVTICIEMILKELGGRPGIEMNQPEEVHYNLGS